jgi:hypothetical protein
MDFGCGTETQSIQLSRIIQLFTIDCKVVDYK